MILSPYYKYSGFNYTNYTLRGNFSFKQRIKGKSVTGFALAFKHHNAFAKFKYELFLLPRRRLMYATCL